MIRHLVLKNIKLIIVLIGISLLIILYFYNSYYFDFDRIEHYKITKEIDYFDRHNDSIKADNKEILSELLFDRKPSELNGQEFLDKLDKVIFKKYEIPATDLKKLKEIFKEQNCYKVVMASCIPVYRDILVFYKKNEIVGIAKICFGCRDNHIVGTTSNTFNFGQCGKYEELVKILY